MIIFDLLLFTILRNKNKLNLYLNYFLLFPFSLFTLLVSSWGVINSLRGVSWRLGFPLYSDGLDPHVFGPAMACAFIGLFYIFINFKDYYDGKNKNLLRILIFLVLFHAFQQHYFAVLEEDFLYYWGFQ